MTLEKQNKMKIDLDLGETDVWMGVGLCTGSIHFNDRGPWFCWKVA